MWRHGVGGDVEGEDEVKKEGREGGRDSAGVGGARRKDEECGWVLGAGGREELRQG